MPTDFNWSKLDNVKEPTHKLPQKSITTQYTDV